MVSEATRPARRIATIGGGGEIFLFFDHPIDNNWSTWVGCMVLGSLYD
jgi:hypothetical protein